jgi:phage baseplate assembly protein V
MFQQGNRHQTPNLAASPRYAIVDHYDPNTHRANVVLAPSADGKNPLTGMLPVVTGHMGAGWGIVSPLKKGDQVIVLFMQNHPDQGVILGRIFDQPHPPPKRADNNAAQAGEIVIKDQVGNLIQLGDNQKIVVNGVLEIDLTGPTITLTATTAVNIVTPALNIGGASGGSCSVTITGTVTASGEGTFNGGHTVSQHKHPGVQTGSGQTGAPTG